MRTYSRPTRPALPLIVGAVLISSLSFVGAPKASAESSDHKYGSVSGKVVDTNGKPVAHAIVSTQDQRHGVSGPTTQSLAFPWGLPRKRISFVYTKADGTFTLDHVPTGQRDVVGYKKGVGRGDVVVKVSDNAEVTVTITLEPIEKN